MKLIKQIISGFKKIEVLHQKSKEYESILTTKTKNIQEMWDTKKAPNLKIIRINKSQEFQVNNIEPIFHKTTEKKFPKLKKYTPIQIQDAHKS